MNDNLKKYYILFFIPIVFLIGYLIFLLYVTYPISTYSIEKAGQLGDSFGILNTLFSGFGFVALILTLLLQKQEIDKTQKEIQKQNFENNFFNMLKIHNDVLTNFRQTHFYYSEKGKQEQHTMYGHEAISFFLDEFKKGGTAFYSPNENLSKEENKNNAQNNRNLDSDTLRINIKHKLGRKNLKFIETIYSVLNLIDRTIFLEESDRNFYLETLMSQISDEELILIFYYTHGLKSDMKPLIEKYCFFKNLDEQLLHNWEEEIKLYDKQAFNTLLWQFFTNENKGQG